MHWGIYLLLGALATGILLMQYNLHRRARLTEGRAAPDTTGVDGEGALRSARRVYYFYGRHCGPCKAMTPIIERVRRDHPNLIKLDIAEAHELARQFGIVATPSFVMVESGTIRKVRLGGMTEQQLLAMLGTE